MRKKERYGNIHEEFKDLYGRFVGTAGLSHIIWNFIVNSLDHQRKAYGGCTDCYGKGYSTEMVGNTIVRADFEGDRERVIQNAHVRMNFCACERGKQLQGLFDHRKRRRYD